LRPSLFDIYETVDVNEWDEVFCSGVAISAVRTWSLRA
jgi:hypothetical protein